MAQDSKSHIFSRNFLLLKIFFILCFSFIVLRLWYLQVMQGDYFRNRSENNRIRTRYLPAPRGFILDRYGKILVSNKPSYNIEYIPEDVVDFKDSIRELSKIIQISEEEIYGSIEKFQSKRKRFEPKIILKNVEFKTLTKVIANIHSLPGITYSVVPKRKYLYNDFASHILGYVREISSKQLGQAEYARYHPGEIVGKYGIEASQENYLQGKRGVQGVIVNARGTKISESYFEPEQTGHNVYLTIDFYLQELAESLLENRRGVLLLMSVKTGEIYAMASKPGFDLNVFTREITSKEWKELLRNPENRLTNRGTQGLYPPGSLFKPIIAAAALKEGEIDTIEKIYCNGLFRIGKNAKFRCHKRSGHGNENLIEALSHSCNVFFYDVGQRLGIDRISSYAEMFGLGKATEIFGLKENLGVVPSRAWKKEHFKHRSQQRWYPGETPSVSVGQGSLRVTPLQLARAYAVFATKGYLIRPNIVKSISAQEGAFSDTISETVREKLPISKEIFNKIEEGLVKVINEGTGKNAQLLESLNIQVAGKTGTAQIKSFIEEENISKEETHAWFAGYAPVKKPEVVIVSLVETGGHGGEIAAPLARKLLEAYFSSNNFN